MVARVCLDNRYPHDVRPCFSNRITPPSWPACLDEEENVCSEVGVKKARCPLGV